MRREVGKPGGPGIRHRGRGRVGAAAEGGLWRRLRRLLGSSAGPKEPALPSREILDHLLRTCPGLLAFKDAVGVYRCVNDAMARHLGLEHASEALGRTDAELQPFRGGPRAPAEEPGAAEWELSTTAVRDEAGRLLGTLVLGRDLREREAPLRRAEAAEEERNLLRTILNCIPDQIYAKNARHEFVVANAAVARKIEGAPQPERILGKTDHDFFPKEDADGYRQDETRLMASGRGSVELEEQALYQGRVCWNQTTKVVLRDAQGHIEGLVGINRDVTARKEAEAALAAERNLLHSLMENIPDCIYFKDVDVRFVRANPAQAAFLGAASPAQLVGRRLSGFLGGRAVQEVEAAEKTVLESGTPLVGRLEPFERADGASVWMLSTKVPLHDADGRITGLVAISRDVTERRRAEEALESSLASFLQFANRVAEGDLTLRAPEGADTVGRIGSAVNRMLESFAAILADASRTVAQVATSAQEVLAASRYIADGAERQSGEVLSTSASVEELAASMQGVSRDATAWADSARGALEHVGVGDASVERNAEAMSRISAAVEQTAAKMRLLAARVAEISGVIELIDDIASQSTMLSLNAAIQAAHAGEAGRGFGVVADEIRSLAERSTRATRDVARIIETIQGETAEAMEATKNGTREVRKGLDLAEQARHALGEISGAVGETVDLSVSISTASTEQAQITRQLAETMEHFASISQSSSSSAHESAQAVQALVGLARELEGALGRFRIGVGAAVGSSGRWTGPSTSGHGSRRDG